MTILEQKKLNTNNEKCKNVKIVHMEFFDGFDYVFYPLFSSIPVHQVQIRVARTPIHQDLPDFILLLFFFSRPPRLILIATRAGIQ